MLAGPTWVILQSLSAQPSIVAQDRCVCPEIWMQRIEFEAAQIFNQEICQEICHRNVYSHIKPNTLYSVLQKSLTQYSFPISVPLPDNHFGLAEWLSTTVGGEYKSHQQFDIEKYNTVIQKPLGPFPNQLPSTCFKRPPNNNSIHYTGNLAIVLGRALSIIGHPALL